MASTTLNKIAKGVLSGAALTAVSAFVGVANLRLIVNALSPDVAGVWIVLLTIGNYLVFFDIGFGPTLSREIAFADGRANDDESRSLDKAHLVATTQRTITAISIALSFIGGPLGWYALERAAIAVSTRELLQTWITFLVGGFLAMNGSVAHSTLYGLGHVALERGIRVFAQLCWLLLTFIFLKLGWGLHGAALAWVIQALLARMAAFAVLHRFEPWLRKLQGSFRRDLFQKMLPPSLKWAATTLGALLILQSGNLIIAGRVDLASVASYEALSKLSMAVMTLGLLIATSSSPFLSRMHAAHDRVGFESVFFRNLRIGLAITVACVLFALFFGELIVQVWLGDGHFAGFATLAFLMIMTTLEVHHVIFATAAMAAGFVPFAPYAIGAGILNVIFGLILTGPFGLVGMAFSTFLAQVVTNNWFAPYFAFKKLKLDSQVYLKDVLRPISIFTIVNVAGLLMTRKIVELSSSASSLSLLQAFVLHAVAVLITLYFLILNSEERRRVRTFLRLSHRGS